MSQYRGRRSYRRRGINPMVLVMMAAIIVAAVILVLVSARQDKQKEPTPPQGVQDVQPTPPEGETGEEEQPPEDPTPVVTEPERIEVKGTIKPYSGVYCVGDTCYEYYTYVDSVAQKYAQCVNQVADALKGTSTVYDMIIPLSSGVTLPDDLFGTAGLDDQKSAEQKAYSYMGDNVIPVPLYETMMAHRTEYIYFRSDHHWTGTGAYYAYTQFCKAKGITPNDLSAYETVEFPGFLGSFYNDSGKDAEVGANPDTVVAYYPLSDNVTMAWNDISGVSIIYDESSAPAGLKYGAYLWGDNDVDGFNTITNPNITDGSSCIVVKESFGNPFVPFLTDHYSTVYVIDCRYWKGSLTEFAKTNHVNDVIFSTNIGAATRGSWVGNLHGVL